MSRTNKLSKRRQLIKKIIREELAAVAKEQGGSRKILSEGLRTPEPTMHEPAENKAIRSRTPKSDMTSFVDPPNANLDRGDGRGRYFVEEAAGEGDRKEFGVGIDGHIEAVPGHPTEDDHEPSINETVDPREEEGIDPLGDPIQSLARAGRRPAEAVEPLDDREPSLKGQLPEAQVHRWKQLARIIEQDDTFDFDQDIEARVAPPIDQDIEPRIEPLPDLPDDDAFDFDEIELEPFEAPDPGEGLPIDTVADATAEAEKEAEAAFVELGVGTEEGIPEVAPAHRDNAAISLRIREEITRILKEKL